jgi:hypothetical protein
MRLIGPVLAIALIPLGCAPLPGDDDYGLFADTRGETCPECVAIGDPEMDVDSLDDTAGHINPDHYAPGSGLHTPLPFGNFDDWMISFSHFNELLKDPTTPKPKAHAYQFAKVVDLDGVEREQRIPWYTTAEKVNALRKDVIFPVRKKDPCNGGPCIDVHNHFMGIPQVKDIVDLAAAKQAKWADARKLLQEVIICMFFWHAVEKDRDAFRDRSPHVYYQLRQMVTDPDIDLTKGKPKLKDSVTDEQARKMIEMTLTATNRTPFGNAYEPRSGFVEVGKPPIISWEDYAKKAIAGLKSDNLVFSEQSFGIGKLKIPDAIPATRVKKLGTDIGSSVPGLPQDVRFLPMLNTFIFATENGHIRHDEQEALAKIVLMRPDVVGMDIAGPESMPLINPNPFKAMYAMLSRAARTRRRPMVLRVHVGEGSFAEQPRITPGRKAKDCAADGLWNVWCPKRKGDAIDFQIEVARKNLDTVISWIEKLKDEEEWSRDWVQIRFGHVTMLTEEHAKKMRDLGITAEVNPISNLVTGAIQPECEELRATPDEGNLSGLAEDTITNDKHRMYRRFPLLTLLYYDVPTILNTDAQSVMHTGIADQYKRAEKIIDWYKADLIPFSVNGKPVLYSKLSDAAKAKLNVQRLRDWAMDYWQQLRQNDLADRNAQWPR